MICIHGGFLKSWYPTNMGFPTKNDHSGVFWGYHHFRKPPYVMVWYDYDNMLWYDSLHWFLRVNRVTVTKNQQQGGSPLQPRLAKERFAKWALWEKNLLAFHELLVICTRTSMKCDIIINPINKKRGVYNLLSLSNRNGNVFFSGNLTFFNQRNSLPWAA